MPLFSRPARLSPRTAANAFLLGLDVAGHAAAGFFFSNTRIIGLPEGPFKALILFGHAAAWPLFGLLQGLRAGGLSSFLSSLVRPFTFTRAWNLAFTLLGLRWALQEAYRRTHPTPRPPEIVRSDVAAHDLRDHVARKENLPTGGLQGLAHRLNQIYSLELTTHELSFASLPPEMDGFTIVQIADPHYGDFASVEFIRCFVELTLGLEPDLVALTGDYQTYPKDVGRSARLLAPIGEWSLRERGGSGAVAVLGNHDRESGAAHVTDALRRSGIKVLHNSCIRVSRGTADIYVAGVADPWSYRADLHLALHDVPQGSFTILLAHVPDYLAEASRFPVALQLSGHNHGGQIKLPVAGPLVVSSRYGRRYAEGFHKMGNTLMYASRGLGGKPPIRWGAKPELARFILRSASS